MTALIGTVVPGMVLIGSVIGSYLREMSKEAQRQVCFSFQIGSILENRISITFEV